MWHLMEMEITANIGVTDWFNLRFWHTAPLYPEAHWHCPSAMHTPPFWHAGLHLGADQLYPVFATNARDNV